MNNFYTSTIQNDVRFKSTSCINDPGLLEPVTRQKVVSIILQARALGLELMIFETYRSKERQEMLYLQGVTQLRAVGVHHFGLACDLVKRVNGRPSWEGDFSLLGKLAYTNGLIWGGDWGNPFVRATFLDLAHVQRCTVAMQTSLFSLQWYPEADYNPYCYDLKM
jgi:hypothetical protein